MPQKVLFLCTGNYYRSRYAEIVFNWKTAMIGANWQAFSRGLNTTDRNQGPLSPHTVKALRSLGIPVEPHLRHPIRSQLTDFQQSDLIVAIKETEHRPMLQELFPNWVSQVEFWSIDDIDCSPPELAIPQLDREIQRLIHRLSSTPR